MQTLSRLNRTAKGRQDTFVLDFVNSTDEIQEAFEPYYEETILEEETDPNVVYDLKNTLDAYRIYQQTEVERAADLFYSGRIQKSSDLGKFQGTFRPALDRFDALEPDRQDLFKSTLARFNRIYSFITQVCRLFDKEMSIVFNTRKDNRIISKCACRLMLGDSVPLGPGSKGDFTMRGIFLRRSRKTGILHR